MSSAGKSLAATVIIDPSYCKKAHVRGSLSVNRYVSSYSQ